MLLLQSFIDLTHDSFKQARVGTGRRREQGLRRLGGQVTLTSACVGRSAIPIQDGEYNTDLSLTAISDC